MRCIILEENRNVCRVGIDEREILSLVAGGQNMNAFGHDFVIRFCIGL